MFPNSTLFLLVYDSEADAVVIHLKLQTVLDVIAKTRGSWRERFALLLTLAASAVLQGPACAKLHPDGAAASRQLLRGGLLVADHQRLPWAETGRVEDADPIGTASLSERARPPPRRRCGASAR